MHIYSLAPNHEKCKLLSSNFQTVIPSYITFEKYIFKMASHNNNGFYLLDFYYAPGMHQECYIYTHTPKSVQQPHTVNSTTPFYKF